MNYIDRGEAPRNLARSFDNLEQHYLPRNPNPSECPARGRRRPDMRLFGRLFSLLFLFLLLESSARADCDDFPEDGRYQGGCNVFGCYPPGGGCNVFGCYGPGGDCNVHGCYQSGGGCNVHGCYGPGGGCNVHGCWSRQGGCSVHGCWNSPYGSCNIHGCSDYGECTIHGCPTCYPEARRGRHRRSQRHSRSAQFRLRF